MPRSYYTRRRRYYRRYARRYNYNNTRRYRRRMNRRFSRGRNYGAVIPRNNMSALAGQMHIKRQFTVTPTYLSESTPDFATQNIVIALSDLPDYTEFQNLFQMYRFNLIKMVFTPDITTNFFDELNNVEVVIPEIWTVADPVYPVPLTQDAYNQHPSLRKTMLNKPVIRFFKPAVAVETTVDSNAMSRPKWKQWINTGNADVGHEGFAWAYVWTNIGGNTLRMHVNLDITVYMSVKGIK